MSQSLLSVLIIIIVGILFFVVVNSVDRERSQWRETAYKEELGEEYDLELNRLLELKQLQPKDTSLWPDPYRKALENVRLKRRTIAKSRASSDKTQPMKIEISNSIIAALNLGPVHGDLTASVRDIQSHGQQQIADAIGKLARAIAESKDIDDAKRKDLLENLAQVSKEVSCQPEQRRAGLLRSSLGFINRSLGAINTLIPLVNDLHEKLRAAGIIDW